MSLLSHEEIRVVLGPDGVTMARMGRGMRPRIAARKVLPCAIASPQQAPWVPALNSLDEGLAALGSARMDAMVVVSNHFTRYALVPWSEKLSNEAEEQAFVRHCFSQIYGNVTDGWALKLSPGGYGETQVACAIDRDLMQQLEAMARVRNVRIVSIQPYLMTVFNRWRHQIHGSLAWLAVAERGRLCLALLRDGQWCNLKTVNIDDGWPAILLRLLEREFMLSEAEAKRGAVFVFAPGHDKEPVLEESGWNIRWLGNGTGHGHGADADIQLVLMTLE